jgi:hypothetical protein
VGLYFYFLNLKGPKREMFVARIFTEIRPVWVGDIESRPKNLKVYTNTNTNTNNLFPPFPGLIYVKKNRSRISHAWTPLICGIWN